MKYWIYASIQRPILVCFTCISGLFSEVLGYNLNLIVSYYFSLDQISVNETYFTSFSVSWGKWLLQHQFFSGPQVAMSRLQATDLLSPCVRFTRISLVQILLKKSRLSLWTSLSWTVLIILPTEKLPVARYENVTICKESSERECVFLQVICSLEYCYRDTIIISIREEVSSVRQLNPSICWTID